MPPRACMKPFSSYRNTRVCWKWLLNYSIDKCMRTYRRKRGFREIPDMTVCFTNNVKTIPWNSADKFGVRLVESRLCYSRSNRSPLRWQSPAVSSNRPLPSSAPSGPSPNHRLALSPREVQRAAARPQDHPCPSSHTLQLFPTHLYSDGQAHLLLSTLATRLVTRGHHVGRCSYFMVLRLPYKDRRWELSTFIVLFCFKVLPDWANFHNCMFHSPPKLVCVENKNSFPHLITTYSFMIACSHSGDV